MLKIPDVLVVVNRTHATLFLDVSDDQKDVQFSVYWCKKDFKVTQQPSRARFYDDMYFD